MKTFKKSLAVLLAVLLTFGSGILLASAEGVYTVTFDANGGSFGTGAVTLKAVSSGDSITSEGITIPTFTFKTFLGWSLDQNAETGEADPTAEIGKMEDASVTVFAIWANASCGENANYTVSGSVLTIHGSGVIEPAAEWAGNAPFFTKVVFAPDGESFDGIAPAAFAGFSALKEIDLTPVATVEGATEAFLGCSSLQKAVLPADTEIIPAKFFKGCSALSEFAFEGITAIGAEAFLGCTSMPNVLVFEEGLDLTLDPAGKALGYNLAGQKIDGYTIVTDGESLTAYAKANGFYMSHLNYTLSQAFSIVRLVGSKLGGLIPTLWAAIRNAVNSLVNIFRGITA